MKRTSRIPEATVQPSAPLSDGDAAPASATPASVTPASATQAATGPIEELREQVARLSGELQQLRAQVGAIYELERFRDVVLERHSSYAAPPARARRLEARDFVEGTDGFHNLEYDEHGMAYRWTGPGHFTRARFHVDRSAPVTVVLRLSSLGRHTVQDRITVDIDGTVYPMRLLGGDGIAFGAGPVPARAGAGLTDLFFHIPVTFRPRDSGIEDARTLGVAVLSIELTPDL